MAISVRFRGPMLFVTDQAAANEADDVVNRVIIPDASGLGFHADASEAVPHTTALFVSCPHQPRRIIPLAGKSVRIAAAGEHDLPLMDSRFRLVPPLHEMTNPEGTPPTEELRLSATMPDGHVAVTITGGRMSGELITKAGIELPQRRRPTALRRALCSMPVWTSASAVGTIEITDGDSGREVVNLDSTVDAFIYNWDVGEAIPDSLVQPIVLPESFQDHDFKWVYQMLSLPAAMTWDEWRGPDRYLPAPRSVDFLLHADQDLTPAAAGAIALANAIVAKMTPPNPSTGTCDSARWRVKPVEA